MEKTTPQGGKGAEMSETTTTQATEETTTTPAAEDKGFVPITTQKDFDEVFNKRWGREKAKYDEFETYKASHEELGRLQEANKSDGEKLRERAETAEAKLQKLEEAQQVAAWKKEVSGETGVPEAALSGSTKEEIETKAKELAPYFAKNTTPPAPGQGKTPPAVDAGTDPLRELFNKR
jgi:hypothetical protein